ncbi:MAG: helix-turn-helix domain-containing protein [Thermoanaerobaculia bacterium]
MAERDTEMKSEQREWSLAELAEEVGLPARTVRFYIGRGLMPGPEKAGRGASYGQEHLERLQEIQRLQANGLTLAEISMRGEEVESASLPEPEAWWTYPIADGVEVRVRADQAPWRLRQIRRALAGLGQKLDKERDSSAGSGGRQGGKR